ncbi:CubicO group peptidase (beta-lactamase class C family) [Curtobacterium luteum]|uniref:CubicO group peptidase (Beta-lactamase class C family) n=1 Tax=Curtobacterium luteum TaxID=33881 RepID=A0A8H9GBA9_9MICO|nr:serine hydrolase domain-containing protein [Curtobacterium luteum]MBM7800909.1 CubicO group peptidase (beta-lactamase class C family) [Curtobacterium luteum]GGL09684.1 serine hydrolase [Curtobacterium luteum]
MTDTLAAYRKTLPYIHDWVSYKVWQLRVPGVQVAIGYAGEVLFEEAWGHADVEAGRRLTTTDLFRIASHSKTFTATALLLLAERGALRLDDTVGTYVPALADGGSPLADATLRELMEMGAGVIRDGHDGDYWSLARPFPDEEELLALVLDRGQKVPAGSSFNYSNLGYSLLGLVIAAVSGTTYNDFVREAITEPLGLRNTGPDWDPTRADDFVVGYTGFHTDRRRHRIDHVDTRAMAAATGFHGTAGDLVRYFSQHVIGQGALLSDHSKRLAQRKAWSATDDPADRGYGAGFVVDRIGGREVRGHSGGFPGHITQSLFDPASGLVVSVLTSAAAGPATLIATAIIELLDRAAADDAPGAPVPDGVDPATFTGRFANPWGVTDIALVGDRLLEIDPAAPAPLESPTRLEVVDADTLRMTHGNRFGSIDEDVTYSRDADGTTTGIRAGGGMSLTAWSVPVEPPAVAAGVEA